MSASGGLPRRILRFGALGGIAMLYLTAVGLVLAFSQRDTITGVLTFGRLMLIVPPLAAGFAVAGGDRRPVVRLTAGLLAGAIGGVMLAALILLATAVPEIRTVLIRISPALVEFLSFGQSAAVGAALNVGLAALAGLIGAGTRMTPHRLRRSLIWGALGVVIVSILEPLLRPRLTDFELRQVARFLFEHQGLTIPGAVAVFATFALVAALWMPVRRRVARRIAASDEGRRATIRGLGILFLVLFLLALPQIAGSFFSQVLVFVGFYALLGLGLNIVVGYAGLLDLGYVAFYAVGAYMTALLTSPLSSLGLGLPFWVALPLVILGAAAVGLFIGAPVLRLRGDYLAIVTLGFGEIARILFQSDALAPVFGGVRGILGVPPVFGVATVTIPILGWELSGPTLTYYPLLFFCGAAAFVAYRLKYSRIGRAWTAMREDEDVAEATGVNIVNYKLLAFAIGASVGCLAGAVFVTHLQSVYPGTFDVLVSITTLAIIILGGMGSIPGVIVGAFVLIGLPELLREFAEFRLLIYGAVLVVMMIARPEGLVPDVGRKRELHESEEHDEPDATGYGIALGAED